MQYSGELGSPNNGTMELTATILQNTERVPMQSETEVRGSCRVDAPRQLPLTAIWLSSIPDLGISRNLVDTVGWHLLQKYYQYIDTTSGHIITSSSRSIIQFLFLKTEGTGDKSEYKGRLG